jgi:hypothetical protein
MKFVFTAHTLNYKSLLHSTGIACTLTLATKPAPTNILYTWTKVGNAHAGWKFHLKFKAYNLHQMKPEINQILYLRLDNDYPKKTSQKAHVPCNLKKT